MHNYSAKIQAKSFVIGILKNKITKTFNLCHPHSYTLIFMSSKGTLVEDINCHIHQFFVFGCCLAVIRMHVSSYVSTNTTNTYEAKLRSDGWPISKEVQHELQNKGKVKVYLLFI